MRDNQMIKEPKRKFTKLSKKQMKKLNFISGHEINPTNFGVVLGYLKLGYKAYRSGWNGKNMYIKLQEPDLKSKMTLPYIYMKTAQEELVPWLASQTDMLAEDWLILENE